jgi:exopolysaccharide biosynthesis WecB/TagA/CpsF family protein
MFVPQDQSGMNDAAPAAPRRAYRLTRRPEERVRVLGGVMDLVRPEEVFHFVTGKLEARQSAIVANHNLHSLYLIGKDHQIGEFYKQADLIEVDSVPLIFWARLVGRASRRFHRCTYLDWRDDFWSLATQKNWKVFFVGGAPGVAEKAVERIHQDYPTAQIASHHGYFDVKPGSAANDAVVEAIRAFAPDIVLVGMGMPRQEIWTLENHEAYGWSTRSACSRATASSPGRWSARPAVTWSGRWASVRWQAILARRKTPAGSRCVLGMRECARMTWSVGTQIVVTMISVEGLGADGPGYSRHDAGG